MCHCTIPFSIKFNDLWRNGNRIIFIKIIIIVIQETLGCRLEDLGLVITRCVSDWKFPIGNYRESFPHPIPPIGPRKCWFIAHFSRDSLQFQGRALEKSLPNFVGTLLSYWFHSGNFQRNLSCSPALASTNWPFTHFLHPSICTLGPLLLTSSRMTIGAAIVVWVTLLRTRSFLVPCPLTRCRKTSLNTLSPVINLNIYSPTITQLLHCWPTPPPPTTLFNPFIPFTLFIQGSSSLSFLQPPPGHCAYRNRRTIHNKGTTLSFPEGFPARLFLFRNCTTTEFTVWRMVMFIVILSRAKVHLSGNILSLTSFQSLLKLFRFYWHLRGQRSMEP